jgi:hypothetical protein
MSSVANDLRLQPMMRCPQTFIVLVERRDTGLDHNHGSGPRLNQPGAVTRDRCAQEPAPKGRIDDETLFPSSASTEFIAVGR